MNTSLWSFSLAFVGLSALTGTHLVATLHTLVFQHLRSSPECSRRYEAESFALDKADVFHRLVWLAGSVGRARSGVATRLAKGSRTVNAYQDLHCTDCTHTSTGITIGSSLWRMKFTILNEFTLNSVPDPNGRKEATRH